jgi:hypothetical protein
MTDAEADVMSAEFEPWLFEAQDAKRVALELLLVLFRYWFLLPLKGIACLLGFANSNGKSNVGWRHAENSKGADARSRDGGACCSLVTSGPVKSIIRSRDWLFYRWQKITGMQSMSIHATIQGPGRQHKAMDQSLWVARLERYS